VSGDFGAPYRPPCGGWTEKPKLYLGCGQNKKSGESHIPVMENTTRVPGYVSGEAIQPYTRGTPGFCFPPQPCAPWPEPVPLNTFALKSPAAYEDAPACEKAGFKNVYAIKAWHGRYGFDDNDGCFTGEDTRCPDPASGGPRSTKYLIKAMSGTKIATQVAGGVAHSWSWGRTYSINRFSGKVTLAGDIQTHHYHGDASYNDVGELVSPEVNIDDTATDDHLIALCNTDYRCGGYTGEFAGGMLNTPLDELNDNLLGLHHERTISQSTTHISIYFRRYTDEPDTTDPTTGDPVPFNNSNEVYHVTIALGGAYSSDDVNADVRNLLGTWSLASDKVYPWRVDGHCTHGPLVSYYELPPNTPDQFTEVGWVDVNPHNGEVMGAPTPAGYEKFFNFRQPVYREGQIVGRGQAAADWARHATQWTDDSMAGTFPPGAFISFGIATGLANYLVACKYAEILLPKPSHSFGRPWGRDRYAIDQTTASCITDLSDGVVTVDGAPAITSGNKCLVAGFGDEDGVYQVTRLTASTFALNSKIRDVPTTLTSLDAVFGKLRWPDAPAIAGRVKVKTASNTSPIVITLGGDAIKFAFPDTNDEVTIEAVQGNTAANGTWTVTKTDGGFSLNGSTGNGGYTSGGFASSPGAAGHQWHDNRRKGDWCLITWGYNYRDVGERARLHQNFLDRDAIDTYRALFDLPSCGLSDPAPIRPNTGAWSSITASQNCSAYSACEPSVVAITPNGEHFANGQTFAMPTLPCDDRYGSNWQSAPKQWMDDPLWQVPHRPCGLESGWSNDGGFCHNPDGDGDYYPMAPQEECRVTVPGGAPAMPSGTYLGSLNMAQLNTTPVPAGNVIYPPGNNTCFGTPGVTYIFQKLCIEGSGRFACNYSDPESLCDEMEFNY
jgi:hypothetical protein